MLYSKLLSYIWTQSSNTPYSLYPPQAQLIAQSIGQAFQVAYLEFLKANGIADASRFKVMDYQEVLNQQEIFGEDLFLFSNKEMQKEVGNRAVNAFVFHSVDIKFKTMNYGFAHGARSF